MLGAIKPNKQMEGYKLKVLWLQDFMDGFTLNYKCKPPEEVQSAKIGGEIKLPPPTKMFYKFW